MQPTLKAHETNNFVIYLNSIFGKTRTNDLVNKYKIGSSKKWSGGSTVFWQIDINGNVRTGRIMKYDTLTGRRLKEPFNHISWVHSTLQLKNFNLKQCFFGEHLLNTSNFPVASVESEKTAVISSFYFPQFIWLASGSLQNLKSSMFERLKGRSIILFPDTSLKGIAFNKWLQVATELVNLEYNCITSDFLELNASIQEKENGVDLADYLVKYAISEFLGKDNKVYNQKELELESMIERNSSIRYLIDRFDLST